MRLGLYTRISEDPDGRSDATERQEAACRLWAERNGHEIVAVYEDRDLSGYKGVVRPQFLALLDAGHEGILCWRIDRLLRNWQDWAKLDTLLESGTVLFSEDGTDSRRDGLILSIKVGFAREESRKISDRLKSKYATQARNGEPAAGGHRPFGYTREREVVQDEAVEIRRAVERLLSGGSMRPITDDWNRRGVQTTTGRQWNPSVLRLMLRKSHLAGMRSHLGVLYKGKWEPIISEDQHRQLQSLFDARARSRPLRKHWMSGLFNCAVCGAALGADGTKYKCPCGKVTILIAHAEQFATGEVLAELRKKKVERKDDSQQVYREIAEAEGALREVDDAYLIHRRVDRFAHSRAREYWEGKLRSLRNRMPSPLPAGDVTEAVWAGLTIQERSGVASLVIEHITVSPPGRGKRRFDPSVFSCSSK